MHEPSEQAAASPVDPDTVDCLSGVVLTSWPSPPYSWLAPFSEEPHPRLGENHFGITVESACLCSGKRVNPICEDFRTQDTTPTARGQSTPVVVQGVPVYERRRKGEGGHYCCCGIHFVYRKVTYKYRVLFVVLLVRDMLCGWPILLGFAVNQAHCGKPSRPLFSLFQNRVHLSSW